MIARLRPIIGLTLLAIVLIWAVREGTLFHKINAAVLLQSTLLSSASLFVNALTIRLTARVFGGSLSNAKALRVSALGALGNSLGGLPIGTALKYAILYRSRTLGPAQLTAGLAVFSAAISLGLLATASVSVWGTTLEGRFKLLPAIALVVAALILMGAGLAARRTRAYQSLIAPFLSPRIAAGVSGLGAATSILFVANYWVIARTLVPQIGTADILFISSAGILVGLGSLLQSVGGVQELSLAMLASSTGHVAVDGVQLALVMRLSAILASAALIAATSFERFGDTGRRP